MLFDREEYDSLFGSILSSGDIVSQLQYNAVLNGCNIEYQEHLEYVIDEVFSEWC